MPILSGNILKMRTVLGDVVEYYLPVSSYEIKMNELIGAEIRISFTGEINCINCGNPTKRSFGQGYCYPCFISVPETEDCVLRPELCRAHEGLARDMEYASSHCLIDHFVYLADSGGIKVGVTRHTQVPVRWIDQGASSAICVARTPNRYIAGLIEVELKKFFPDRTNWRLMLTKAGGLHGALAEKKTVACEMLSPPMKKFITMDNTITCINYPVISYPIKVKSLALDKNPEIKGKIDGIIGQYIIIENAGVLNIRKHNGYKVEIEY